MVLSRAERRVLDQIGRTLQTEDPELGAQLSAPRGRSTTNRVGSALGPVTAAFAVLAVLLQIWPLLVAVVLAAGWVVLLVVAGTAP